MGKPRVIADAFDSQLQEYIDGVLCGEIVVCRLVRKAVERHLSDLNRQSTQSFPYHFDAKHAAKVCRFYPRVLRHSIGRFAGMPFELEPWQLFCEAVLFGWLRDSDKTRRFRTSYESVARKNGKSTRAAGRAIFMARYDHNPVVAAKFNEAFSPEPVSQVVLCATKKEQAERVVYAEIERMRRSSPSIRNGSNDARKQLMFSANDGLIMCVGSDKPYDGLNPHNVVMDEIHAWCEYHRPFYDTMVTGSGFRDQPLISYITTAGDDKSRLWIEIYDHAKAVVLGDVVDESYFAFIAELDEDDDPLDESTWIKANPNLGVSISADYLREQAAKCTNAIAINRFTRYHGNRKVSSLASAFDIDKWDNCSHNLSNWKKANAFGAGVDLGGRDDLAAYAIVARFQNGIVDEEEDSKRVWRYEAKVQCYIAENSKRDLTQEPYASWIHEDRIIRCKHPIARLQEDLLADCIEYGVTTLAYDPYNAQQFGEDMEREGMVAARMAQTYAMFNEPIMDLIDAIKDERFSHDGNPVLRWAVRNAITVQDRQLRVMFDKSNSSDKIDPAVALTMAFRIASLQSQASGSLYLS